MKNYKRKILVFITAFMMLMSTGTGVFAVDDVSVDGEAEAQPAAAEEGNTAAEKKRETYRRNGHVRAQFFTEAFR